LEYNQHANIDLHIHSTASDGTLSPAEILNQAEKLRISAISITDHDTIDGSKEALSVGIPSSLQFLTGVEISVSPHPSYLNPGTFHILGYAFRLDDPALNRTLDTLKTARKNRNPKIIERLNDLGINLTMKEVLDSIGEADQIGRPHIAQAMIEKGTVKSIDEAFQKYLAVGKPAYVDKYRAEAAEAIEIILKAGGIPVLAHPHLLRLKKGKHLEDLVAALKAMGLRGIEAHYPGHSPDQTAGYIKIANRNDLLVTGGTDFHGSLKPRTQMGTGTGDFYVPYDLYERISAFSSMEEK